MKEELSNSQFFLVCPIGLEDLLIKELNFKWPLHFKDLTYTIDEKALGGVEITCDRSAGMHLNLILKTPSKILLRLKKQKCRDLPKFYNIIKKYNWKSMLTSQSLNVSISCQKSRLFHTDKIKASFEKAIADYFIQNKIAKKILKAHENSAKQKVFIRINNDDLTLSLDTSGELLHIREDRDFRGHAPIRENIAALLLIALQGVDALEKLKLIDPMCGTGTFLSEANSFMAINKRKYNFQALRKEFYQKLKLNDQIPLWKYQSLHGSDIDQDVISKIQVTNVNFTAQDFFKTNDIDPSVVIMNPPYGKRVKIEGSLDSFFKSIIAAVKKNYNYKLFGIIIPKDYAGNIEADQRVHFNQNGIKVSFLIYKRK